MSNVDDPRSHVQELIGQREQIREWIARLDDAGAPDVPDRVARRVRGDYEERLARVTEELGSHRDELEGELDGLRGSVSGAEERLEESRDALAETRLRHAIGELDDDAWEESRPGLESAASDAEEELARLRDEAERLARLVAEIEGGSGDAATAVEAEEPAADAEEEPAAAGAASPEAESVPDWMRDDETTMESFPTGAPSAGAADVPAPAAEAPGGAGEEAAEEDLPWLDALGADEVAPAAEEEDDAGLEFLREVESGGAAASESASPAPGAPAADAGLGDDDLAFLEELDRAISGEGAAESLGSAPAAEPSPQPATSPEGGESGGEATPADAKAQGRLLCRECGALNEPHAWYCEICGSEL